MSESEEILVVSGPSATLAPLECPAMPETVPICSIVRFGAFEVDLRKGELHKNGLKLRLTGQPFQVLALLVEHPGQVVSREELRKRLWTDDTFVDFDHGLNAVVNRLREVLGESPDRPRFIETVPRRGYCFIAPIEQVHEVLSVSAIEIDQISMPGRVDEIESTSELSLPSKGHAKQTEPTGRRRWNLALVLTAGSVAIRRSSASGFW